MALPKSLSDIPTPTQAVGRNWLTVALLCLFLIGVSSDLVPRPISWITPPDEPPYGSPDDNGTIDIGRNVDGAHGDIRCIRWESTAVGARCEVYAKDQSCGSTTSSNYASCLNAMMGETLDGLPLDSAMRGACTQYRSGPGKSLDDPEQESILPCSCASLGWQVYRCFLPTDE